MSHTTNIMYDDGSRTSRAVHNRIAPSLKKPSVCVAAYNTPKPVESKAAGKRAQAAAMDARAAKAEAPMTHLIC